MGTRNFTVGGTSTGPGFSVVPEVALVILVLCQALDGGHEYVVIAEKVLKDELREGVTEASVTRRILKLTTTY